MQTDAARISLTADNPKAYTPTIEDIEKWMKWKPTFYKDVTITEMTRTSSSKSKSRGKRAPPKSKEHVSDTSSEEERDSSSESVEPPAKVARASFPGFEVVSSMVDVPVPISTPSEDETINAVANIPLAIEEGPNRRCGPPMYVTPGMNSGEVKAKLDYANTPKNVRKDLALPVATSTKVKQLNKHFLNQ